MVGPVAPHGEPVGGCPMETREGEHVARMLVGIEMAHDIGPLAGRGDGHRAGTQAVRQAFDGNDLHVDGLCFQRRMEARARPRFGGCIAFTATGDANEECRHAILLSLGESPRHWFEHT